MRGGNIESRGLITAFGAAANAFSAANETLSWTMAASSRQAGGLCAQGILPAVVQASVSGIKRRCAHRLESLCSVK
jgi:hypothetical protein